MKKVLFLYYGFPEKVNRLASLNIAGVYFRPGSGLVGIDTEISQYNLSKIVKEHSLQEFEVEQEKFESLLKLLPKLGARITSVNIQHSDRSPELENDLSVALENQDIDGIIRIIKEYSSLLDKDVSAIEFVWGTSRIRFTRLAELDLSSTQPESNVSELLSTLPIGILAGLVRGDSDSL
jgi:hypothetical protein